MPASPSGVDDDRLARVRFRRALTLLAMTLVVPGSAQLVAGRKQVGRVAVRIFAGVVAGGALVALLGSVRPGLVYWLVANTAVLNGLRLLLMALAVGWFGLFVDAWRLGQPLQLRQNQRLVMVAVNGVLCFTVVGTLLFASHVVGVQRDFITAMFGDGVVSDAEDGRYNVLLLGGDSGADRWGMRPDSITVASIDESTGRTVLFGLPRNLARFPFNEGSVMNEQFPDGFDCEECYLNGLSTWAQDHSELFTTYDDPGVEATIEGVEGITGLSISYYAMVNLAGFRNLVDAVGGVTLNVRDRIPIGGVGAPVTGYVEPGVRRLDGYQTLWFARSREGADDYSRMARQKCVMNAMLQQLSPRVVITKFEAIASASKNMISTNLPASELDTFLRLALDARSKPLSTVSFVPPMVVTSDPDIDKIRARVQAAIDPRPAGDAQRPARQTGPKSAPATTGGSLGSLSQGYLANDTPDLSSAC